MKRPLYVINLYPKSVPDAEVEALATLTAGERIVATRWCENLLQVLVEYTPQSVRNHHSWRLDAATAAAS